MISSKEFQLLLREHGVAKTTLSAGDHVLGVGVSVHSRFIEHAEVVAINASTAVLKVLMQINIDLNIEPTGTWELSEDEKIVQGVPVDQFFKSIEERLIKLK